MSAEAPERTFEIPKQRGEIGPNELRNYTLLAMAFMDQPITAETLRGLLPESARTTLDKRVVSGRYPQASGERSIKDLLNKQWGDNGPEWQRFITADPDKPDHFTLTEAGERKCEAVLEAVEVGKCPPRDLEELLRKITHARKEHSAA